MTAVKNQSALNRFISTRTELLWAQPFWAMLALKLVVVEDYTQKTAWTDGKRLGYNPDFITPLTFAELFALIAHEVMHCALGHPWRRMGREIRRWNKACDLAINSILRAAGFTLPARALFPEQFELPDGMTAEWYFDRIPATKPKAPPPPQPQDGDEDEDEQQPGGSAGQQDDEQEPQAGEDADPGEDGDADDEDQHAGPGASDGTGDAGEDEGGGPGEPEPAAQEEAEGEGTGSEEATSPEEPEDEDEYGGVRDAQDGTDEEPAPTEAEWQTAVQQAAMLGAGQGSMPAALRRAIDELVKTRVDWRTVMRRFAQEVVRTDYTWTRPNARFLGGGMYMPSLRTEGTGAVAVMVDTSGSIDQVLLSQFAAETRAMVEEIRPRRTYVIYCDTAVHRVEEFGPDEPVTMNAVGGGGTDFRPAFKKLDELEEQPIAAIYMTDLDGDFPERDPGIPTLWITPHRRTKRVPFGEVVSAADG